LPECIGGLHKLFDLNPRGLTLAFSFTTGSRSSVRAILGEALYDRAADVIALPPFSVDEAVGFVEAVIRAWSVDEALAPAPFTHEALASVVSRLDDARAVLTPRILMKAFDRVLRDAEYDIAVGDISAISNDYAVNVLNSLAHEDLA
jgi:hypothetical protein